jgi:hypothetical protein
VSKKRGKDINISANDEDPFRHACEKGHLELAKWLLQISKEREKDIDISIHNELNFHQACNNGHLEVAQWLFQVSKERGQEINISVYNEMPFRRACREGRLDIAQWLQSLKPYLYVIEYDENGNYKDYTIRRKAEANWQKRKYLVWLASNECPEQNKNNLLYKLPSDVSRMVIGFV